jgi:hypothetical protein
MKKLLLLLLSLVVSTTVLASDDDWTKEDTARQAVVLTTFALDYAQTRDIKNHDWAHETNPLLGRHPSDNRVRNYFIGATLLHTVVAYNLRPEWRRTFQYTTIALEVAVIIRNKRIGLHYQF